MGLLAEHLVGRAEELELARSGPRRARSGRADRDRLVGEPGIGKTRLLAELAARADAGGQLVLSGSASELERDLPFSVFVDALDEYVRGLDPELVRRPRRRRTDRARARLPVADGARRRPPAGAPARALPQPPRGARAARAARVDEAARARARRSSLGRLGVRRVGRRAAAPAAGRSRPDGARAVVPRQVPERLSSGARAGAPRRAR